MGDSSKDLLNLEQKSSPSSTIESKLLVCKNNDLRQSQNPKPSRPQGMPLTYSLPKSQVLGKVEDFLGVMMEANKKLQDAAKNNARDYDIEVLTGNESEYIEMDLMLGVTDLHTPEAVAAAESAIAGCQPVITLAANDTGTDSEDSSGDSDDDDRFKKCKTLADNPSSEPSGKRKSKKRSKIIELS